MARTPQMRQLQRLARLGSTARATGIDVAEAEGRVLEYAASDRGLSRRDVLRTGVLAGAGAAVAGSGILGGSAAATAPFTPRTQPKIAVIGAGISGMTAAMTLKDRGFTNITVYEANNRIGGRTYTEKSFWDAGQWSEYGGELIDTNHELIHQLCARFGFPLIDLTTVVTPGSRPILNFGGTYYPWAQMVQDWQSSNLDATLSYQMNSVLPAWPWPYTAYWSSAAKTLSNTNLYDWIERYVPGGHSSRLGKFIDEAYVLEYGAETSQQSCLDLLCLLGFTIDPSPAPQDWWVWGESDERYKIVGGNQQISLAQANYIGTSNVRLGYSLTSLTRNSNGTVALRFDVKGAAPTTITADRVILALPIGVMTYLQSHGGFATAGFDARKTAQIAAMPMGAVNKLHIQTSDRFYAKPGPWGNGDGSSFSDRGYGQFWDSTWGEPGTRGIVVNYFAGNAARAVNPTTPWSTSADPNPAVAGYVQATARNFLRQVEPVFPGMTARYTGKSMLSAWHTSPYQRGAYSYWSPGYVQQFCTYEGVPMGSVHFAGEYCSQDFQGFINGGAMEGQRAALEIAGEFSGPPV